jgi:hypothetical protein
MNKQTSFRGNESGGARAKLIIFLAIVAVVLFAGYNYVPVAWESYQYKDVMQNKVDAAAAQGFDPAWVRDQLVKSGPEYHVPADAVITPGTREGRIEVRVQFTRPIAIPGYTYQYEFDQTVKSTAFLTIK